ncbi:FAD-dependent oxidoreductase [Taibaiella sp. KBW10]|uniref:NAD(P)/FAD-dependent oxidoreductase n=1 Tax=Taibaiella sp. KBW10 TaxID=2153357 RepID=UPI000F5A0C71|nr:NAD(P)/FAD-dependent oxidoreductase [Taibaiella sp. KBW10]RQO31375.1 FAD-dependent oxidoreductase [Taibaiella sp. KBW10]
MRVVIVGGGFAGINLAKSLAGKEDMEVVLVDVNNYNFFPPLIYQVATAFIEPSNISYPFRKMFQGQNNIRFFNGNLTKINQAENFIETDQGRLDYDYLVLAMGTETNFFGMQNVREQALPLKNINDALKIRNTILLNLEKACRTTDPVERQKLMTIVISGGGPTGVEVAGMLGEMEGHVKEKDYPELNGIHTRIYLIDAGNSLLGPMSVKSQQEALRQLTKLGVTVKLSVAVKDYKDEVVYLANGETISTYTLVWVSGVVAKEAPGLPAESIGRSRRILVNEHNLVQGTTNIFAIGDLCYQTTDAAFAQGHPQLAQVAIQQGKLLAKNLENIKQQRALKSFTYNDKGSMAIISKFKAVVDLPKSFMKGFLAWMAWLLIHIMPIAGFRNKVKLFFSWMWSFVTNDPTIRLIIRADKHEGDIHN